MRFRFALALLFVLSVISATAVGEDASALMKVIRSTATSDVDKANAFEKIGDIAGDEQIGPLVRFLGDRKWSHYARFALQKMEGEKEWGKE